MCWVTVAVEHSRKNLAGDVDTGVIVVFVVLTFNRNGCNEGAWYGETCSNT